MIIPPSTITDQTAVNRLHLRNVSLVLLIFGICVNIIWLCRHGQCVGPYNTCHVAHWKCTCCHCCHYVLYTVFYLFLPNLQVLLTGRHACSSPSLCPKVTQYLKSAHSPLNSSVSSHSFNLLSLLRLWARGSLKWLPCKHEGLGFFPGMHLKQTTATKQTIKKPRNGSLN